MAGAKGAADARRWAAAQLLEEEVDASISAPVRFSASGSTSGGEFMVSAGGGRAVHASASSVARRAWRVFDLMAGRPVKKQPRAEASRAAPPRPAAQRRSGG
jgi:hypothetical protein